MGGSVVLTVRERSVRHQRILRMFDRSAGTGLEIGPLYDPVVYRDEADVRYVDVHPGPILKEYYANHPGVPVDDIIDPDFTLIGPEGARTLPQAVGAQSRFAWVVASHVIEHVPDLIGWLAEVAEILDDDGRLILAIPDRRYSFDAARDATTVGEMLLAREHGDKTPSVRAVYDHYRNVVDIVAADAWAGTPGRSSTRIHDLGFTLEQVRQAREDGVYVDCHVWLFTPQSFGEQLAELGHLDQSDFVLDQIVVTAPGELEFYAVLRRLPRALDRAARDAARAQARAVDGLDEASSPVNLSGTGVTPVFNGVSGASGEIEVISSPPEAAQHQSQLLSPIEVRMVHTKRALMSVVRKTQHRVRSRFR
jgi:SAM-dependent methyltransferase